MKYLCFASVLFVGLFSMGIFASSGDCQENTVLALTEKQSEASLSVEADDLFNILRQHLSPEGGEVVVFLSDSFFKEIEADYKEADYKEIDVTYTWTPNAEGRVNDYIKFAQFVGEDASDWLPWDVTAAAATTAKAYNVNETDCRVSVNTSPRDDDGLAFVACWIEVMENCEQGLSVFEIDNEYYIHPNCSLFDWFEDMIEAAENCKEGAHIYKTDNGDIRIDSNCF